MKERMDNIQIICDNGGGITLQIESGDRRYQHHYCGGPQDDAAQCAECIADYVQGSEFDAWDGNQVEEYGWLDPSYDEQRNGAYRVLTIAGVLACSDEDSWRNVRDLKEQLCRVVLS